MIAEKNVTQIAKTLFGLEDILALELNQLGASSIKKGVRHVQYEGDLGFLYKANLCCRTALRILVPIHKAKVYNETDLYRTIKALPWEQYMQVNQTLAVDATLSSRLFTHSKFIALKTKDAIVDRFREREGERPSVDLKHPSLRVHVHIDSSFCTVSLDSSGQSLHKRGYKVKATLAPLNEVLAAGILLLSGWKGDSHFLDPMCGSGTLPIEAAMLACNIPPNVNRPEFGFEHWANYNPDLFDTIEQAALSRVKDLSVSIKGYDIDSQAIQIAKQNAKEANLSDFISFQQKDFFDSKKEVNGPLSLYFNPPYNTRLNLNDVAAFYSKIGSTLKHNYTGTQAWLLSANLEALKHVGLRPSRKIKLFNGPLESKLLGYTLYEGSKKQRTTSL